MYVSRNPASTPVAIFSLNWVVRPRNGLILIVRAAIRPCRRGAWAAAVWRNERESLMKLSMHTAPFEGLNLLSPADLVVLLIAGVLNPRRRRA